MRGVIREAFKEERGAQTGSKRKESRGGVGGDGSRQDEARRAGRCGVGAAGASGRGRGRGRGARP